MPKSDVKIVDHGWGRIKKQVAMMSNVALTVGIQSDAGVNDEGTSIALYAYYNEFGTDRIPERPFIRSTADEQRTKWNGLLDRVFQNALDGKGNMLTNLKLVGEVAQKDIQRKITTLREPPNAPSTIERKGSSNPLIDVGTMRGAIRWNLERAQ